MVWKSTISDVGHEQLSTNKKQEAQHNHVVLPPRNCRLTVEPEVPSLYTTEETLVLHSRVLACTSTLWLPLLLEVVVGSTAVVPVVVEVVASIT